jgi:hypothetical protein
VLRATPILHETSQSLMGPRMFYRRIMALRT